MSATEISPSQSIEASLLNRHASISSHASFTGTDSAAYTSNSINTMADNAGSDAMDHQPSPPPQASNQSQQETITTDAQDHDRMAVDADSLLPTPTNPPQDPSPPSQQASTDDTSGAASTTVSVEPQVLVAVHPASEASPTEPSTDTSAHPSDQPMEQPITEGSNSQRTEEEDNEGEEENEEDDDTSSDEDEYWGGHRDFVAQLKEDTSGPCEDELKELEKGTERSAMDHQYFENTTFTPLDDPEYSPVESGKITWLLKGFHGTKDAPNKQRVMRSDPVNIGQYQWRIKIYPHGNDGTDYISVYVECEGPASRAEPIVVNNDDANMQEDAAEGSHAVNASTAPETKDSGASPVSKSFDSSWEVPAQVSCTMYNPDEPRTYAYERANYQFHDGSPDCGWVRFYGPWTDIHRRHHKQRQAMLRNDTLAFTAYIRVIHDPTKALWFRVGDDGIWDSIQKTGLRGMSAGNSDGNPVIAALAPWLHIEPFRRLMLDASLPDPIRQPRKPVRLLIKALQDVIYRKHNPVNHNPGLPETFTPIRNLMPLYGLSKERVADTIEVWETLRYGINKEYWNDSPSGNNPDVLSFIKTIRQNVRPSLPTETSPPQPLARSVQDIINAASQDSQDSYKDWDGYHMSGPAFPAILQIELCRQRYDESARKWKRLTHHVKLSDKIAVGQHEYKLFAMVISKGELGSGRVYPIVKAGGLEGIWARYKSHQVMYLTQRQAVDSHEGRGDYREGTESVAHIVSYVRSDIADQVLLTPEYQPTSKVMFPLERPPANTPPEALQVVVHDASSFQGHTGFSFVDPWKTENKHVHELTLKFSDDLQAVQKKLLELFPDIERPDQFRLWSVGLSDSDATKNDARDLQLVEKTPATLLAELTKFFDGVRLWLSIIPIEKINPEGGFITVIEHVAAEPVPEIPEPPPDMRRSSPQAFIPMPRFSVSPPPGGLPPPPPGPVDSPAENTTETSTESLPVEVPLLEPLPEFPVQASQQAAVEPTTIPSSEQQSTNNESTHEVSTAPAEDVIMGGTQDQQPVNDNSLPDLPPSTEWATNPAALEAAEPLDVNGGAVVVEVPPPPPPPQRIEREIKIPDWQLRNEVYLMFKVFDPHSQQATGLTSGFFALDTKLADVAAELKMDFKSISFSREVSKGDYALYLSGEDTIRTAGMRNGWVVVISRDDISENDKEIIRARGDYTNFASWYSNLYSLNHFSKTKSFYSGGYCGGKYVHAPLHNGKYIGDSIIIETSGDAYKGNCLQGTYHGQGTMYYANGNKYTGEWKDGLPEGQGTMVYHTTGNHYVGGWRGGRKHGKGVMTFEVADEEMQLCKICYENEMDALFYRCGHVAACESCARQVNDCPVCRRPVDAVVRIWRTV